MSNSAAISKLIKDFSKNPSDISLSMKIGLLYADDGEYENAFEWFSKTYTLDPKNSSAYYFSALVNICMDRYDKATDLWEMFMKTEKSPFDFWSSFRFPFAFDFERLKKKSFILCKNRRKLLPFDTPPVYLSALTHLFLGDMDSALGFFEELNGKKGLPKSFPMILSEVYLRCKKKDQALSVLSDFYKNNPTFAPAPFRIASIYSDMGEYLKASKMYMEAFRIKESPLFLLSAAETFRLAGKEQEAIDCFEGVLYLDDSRPEPFIEIAKDAFKKGDMLSCWMIMLKVEKMNPNSHEAAFYKARVLYEWHDYLQSASMFYKALKLGSPEPEINLLLSYALEEAKEYEEAAYQLLVYINLLEKEDPQYFSRLDSLLRLAKLDNEADDLLESSENKSIFSESFLKNALRMYQNGNFEAAKDFLEKSDDKNEPYREILSVLIERKLSPEKDLKFNILPNDILNKKSCFNSDEKEFMLISLIAEKF